MKQRKYTHICIVEGMEFRKFVYRIFFASGRAERSHGCTGKCTETTETQTHEAFYTEGWLSKRQKTGERRRRCGWREKRQMVEGWVAG